MRLRRLILARYGRFKDFALDFGDAPAETPDIHLIYGPNEAGKSTIHDAYLDLLFGFPRITPYAFMHDNNALRIEAEFQHQENAETVARIKRNKDDLLDGTGQPFAAPVFRQALGRLDRAGYAQMFSLNDETLKAGGESLISAEGDFGSLLYGAASGVAELGARLKALAKAADDIHRKNARSPTEIKTLKAELDEIVKQKRALDVTASHYAGLAQERDKAAEAKDAASKALAEARETLARLTAEAQALPKLQALGEVETALAPLAGLPEAPANGDVRLDQLARATTALSVRQDTQATALQSLQAELETLPEAAPILQQAQALEDEVFQKLTSRNSTATDDIPRRQNELADLDGEIASAKKALGLEPDHRPLTADQIAETERLLDSLPGLETQLKLAADELANASVGIDADAPEADAAMLSRLEAALAEADDHNASRLDDLAAAAKEAEAAQALALARLSPWTGDPDALLGHAPPSDARLAEWRETAERIREQIAESEATVERETAAREAAEAEGAAVQNEAPDDDVFVRLRDERDAAWAQHRQAPTDQTTQAFEALLVETDRAADARLHAANALAEQRSARAAAHKAAQAADAARRKAERLKTSAAELGAAVSAAAASLGLPTTNDLPALEAWLDIRETAIAAIGTARQAAAAQEAARDAARDRAKGLQDALAQAGEAAPADLPLAALRRLGRTTLDRLTKLGDARKALDGRQRGLKTVEAEMKRWRAAWQAATEDSWLQDQTAAVARAKLQPYRDLLAQIGGRDDFSKRINSMQADIDAFERRVRNVAAALNAPFGAGEAAKAAAMFQSQLVEARKIEEQRTNLLENLEKSQELGRTLAAEAKSLGTESAAFLKALGVADMEAARQRLHDIAERDKLREEQSRLKTEIAAAGRPDETVDDLLARLATLDAAHHAAALLAARDTVATAESDHVAAIEADALARRELDALGGDNAAAALEQARQTVLLSLEDAAERHLKLKLGVMAAERALNAYRDLRRSGMLDRASETFRKLTGGSFKGLATQADGTREILIAERGTGIKGLLDKDMSVGTRAQLYLALRVAGYHEVANQGQPPPFVADDILETFDDGRSQAAFEALAEMARHGQVIYLTHHAHLIPLAEAAAPGLKVHRLPDPVGN